MVQKWQDIFHGDSFLFDYNQIWDHYKDPGYMYCAERIAGDNRLLSELRLNGLHSCQVTQAGSPTWLPTYTHGLSMWNDQLSFDYSATDYFNAVFGEEAGEARAWLQKLSDDFDPPYLRHEKEEVSVEAHQKYKKLAEEIRAELPKLQKKGETSRPWLQLFYHAELDVLLAEGLSLRAKGDLEGATRKSEEIHDLAFDRYDDMFGCLDTLIYTEVIKMILNEELTTFSRVVETER